MRTVARAYAAGRGRAEILGLIEGVAPTATAETVAPPPRQARRSRARDTTEVTNFDLLAAIVDGGPKIITFVVDGVLCDGGDERQFGWGCYSPTLRTPNGAATARLAPALRALRIYGCALRTSEAVGNFRAGL